MANNTTLNVGNGGDVIQTEDNAGIKTQIVKPAFGTAGTVTLVSSSNPLPVQAVSVVSTANSSTANLANGAAFTGTSEETTNYAAIQVSVFASHASAANGLSLQQSSDATNWDITDTFTVSATTALVVQIPTQARYFRLVYTNGGTLTTSLRIQTIFKATAPRGSAQRPADATSNENDFEQVMSFGMAYNGTTWDRLRSVNTGYLGVTPHYAGTAASTGTGASGAQTQRVVTATDSTIGTVTTVTTLTGTTTLTPGTGATNLGKAIDSAVGATDTGIGVLMQRTDTLATITPAVGDYAPPRINSQGAQWVQIAGGSISGIVDDAAFTPATSEVLPVGFTCDETATDSVDEGDAGAARITPDRKQYVVAHQETGSIYQAGTARTPVFAALSGATNGDNTLVAAAGAGNKIRVTSLYLVSAGTTTVRFESGAGGTALSGVMSLIANTGLVLPHNPNGWFETAANTLLNMELNAAVQVSGGFSYIVVT